MSTALTGLRVIDLSRGPTTGLSTMILADFGANVVTIDHTDDDLFEQLPAAPMWARGKTRRALTLPQQCDELSALCAEADVFVTNLGTSTLQQMQVDLDQLRADNPRLITCRVTGFGDRGPLANLPGYEHLVAAASGRMMTFQGLVDRPGPVFSALQVGVHATAQSATTGILAALWQRAQTGTGSSVETSVLQGMLPFEQGAMVARQFPERFAQLLPTAIPPQPPLPTLFYHPTQAGDGSWLQFGNLLPHLFDNFLMVTELIDVLADPDFDAKQLSLPADKHEAFRARMLARIQEKTADEWLDLCIENGGVVAGRYQTTQAAMQEPDIIANGHVYTDADGVKQLGPLARLSKTPAQPGKASKSPEQADTAKTQKAAPPTTQTGRSAQPLAGVRVLELATIIAAPLGTSFLADLGAEVIKVEQIGGDPYRGFSYGAGSARVNAGKRSISLNLKAELGQRVVAELAAQADILIHNYRPGVPEKLGFGYADIQAINPQIVYLQCNGYGPDGPGAHRPCTHPIPGAAMGGVLYQMGERVPQELQDFDQLKLWTARLMRANEVNPDPNTALVIATSALLGLVARPQHGGQQVFVDMFGANAYANHDDFVDYPGKQPRALPDEGLYGLHAFYRLYACAEDQWIFLATPQSHEQAHLQDALTALGVELDPEDLHSDAQTAARLAAIFSQQTADYWQAELTPHNIGCVRADRHHPADYWLNNAQAQAMDLTAPATHPSWGDYRRHGANVTVNGNAGELGSPPLAGQHSGEIMTELGFSDAEIEAAFDAGVLWSETR
ncbi:MAG: CoA transferase [Pseudomonadales bacterium]